MPSGCGVPLYLYRVYFTLICSTLCVRDLHFICSWILCLLLPYMKQCSALTKLVDDDNKGYAKQRWNGFSLDPSWIFQNTWKNDSASYQKKCITFYSLFILKLCLGFQIDPTTGTWYLGIVHAGFNSGELCFIILNGIWVQYRRAIEPLTTSMLCFIAGSLVYAWASGFGFHDGKYMIFAARVLVGCASG